MAQNSTVGKRLAMGWTVQGSNLVGGGNLLWDHQGFCKMEVLYGGRLTTEFRLSGVYVNTDCGRAMKRLSYFEIFYRNVSTYYGNHALYKH
jgi:hypothetical protein